MQLVLLIDGQYGSTGKGKVATWLYERIKFGACCSSFGPNAGHTAYIRDSKVPVVLKQIPVGALYGLPAFIGPGSVVDPTRFLEEVGQWQCGDRVWIHPNAPVVYDGDREAERNALSAISSTMQGTAYARCRKLSRSSLQCVPRVASEHPRLKLFTEGYHEKWGEVVDSDLPVLGETAQGWGLSMDSWFYPHVTSCNVNVAACLDALGNIHPHHHRGTVMTCRTYPIRVGNTQDGYSGDVYPDQQETSWDALGLEPEYTTVTKRVRRVFSWSDMMYQESLRAIRPDLVVFTFMDYLPVRMGRVRYAETGEVVSGLPKFRIDFDGVHQWMMARLNMMLADDVDVLAPAWAMSFGPRAGHTLMPDSVAGASYGLGDPALSLGVNQGTGHDNNF